MFRKHKIFKISLIVFLVFLVNFSGLYFGGRYLNLPNSLDKVYQKLFGRKGIFAAGSVTCPFCEKYSEGLGSEYKLISNLSGTDCADDNANLNPDTICTDGNCNAAADDSRCGTIDCPSDSYYDEGNDSATGTNYCRKIDYIPDITTNRCKSIGVCKTSDDCSSTDTRVATCGTCAYCNGSSCAYYPSSQQGPTADSYYDDGADSSTGTNYCVLRDYHCTGSSAAETYDDSTVATCGTCKYCNVSSCANYAINTSCGSCNFCNASGSCKHCDWSGAIGYWQLAGMGGGQTCVCNVSNSGNICYWVGENWRTNLCVTLYNTWCDGGAGCYEYGYSTSYKYRCDCN